MKFNIPSKFKPMPSYKNTDRVTPLVFTALEDNSTIKLLQGGNPNPNEFYTKQAGGEWAAYTIGDAITLNQGQTVEFKGLSSMLNSGWLDRYTFTGTGKWKAEGDIVRLVGDSKDISGQAFSRLFFCGNNLSRDWNFPLVDASKLKFNFNSVLNSFTCCRTFEGCTTLTAAPQLIKVKEPIAKNYTFSVMFYNCTGLKVPPRSVTFPSCNGIGDCESMFKGCTSLTAAPLLPATAIGEQCYREAFSGCTSLAVGPTTLPAVELKPSCYLEMFCGNWPLKTPPTILAVSGADASGACKGMFTWCTSLTASPELKCVHLERSLSCYANMFDQCYSLVSAGPISAHWMDVTNYGMYAMFQGCSSLVQMPKMDAMFGVGGSCCERMFRNCYALTGAEELKFDRYIYGNGCTRMFENCSSLVKLPSALALIAPDWSGLQNYAYMFAGCRSLQEMPSGLLNSKPSATLTPSAYMYMFDGCTALTASPLLPASTCIKSANYCYRGMFNNCTSLISAGNIGLLDFNGSNYVLAYTFYNCSSLVNPPAVFKPKNVSNYGCQYTFYGCKSLTATPVFEFVSLGQNSAEGMFRNCTSLVQVLPLSATSLNGSYSCYEMFYNCSSLVNVPTNLLPATTITNYCYQSMFHSCTSLTAAPDLPASSVGTASYRYMFQNCTNLLDGARLSAQNIGTSGCNLMYRGCTSLTGTGLPSSLNRVSSQGMSLMFRDCTSLVTTPELNIADLREWGCANVFRGCSGIVNAGKVIIGCLSAATNGIRGLYRDCTSLTDIEVNINSMNGSNPSCMMQTFRDCSSLSSIKTNLSAWDQYTDQNFEWVRGVAANGIFYKPEALSTAYGENYIPTNWQVTNAYAYTITIDTIPEIKYVFDEMSDTSGVESTSSIVSYVHYDGQDFLSYQISGTLPQGVTFTGGAFKCTPSSITSDSTTVVNLIASATDAASASQSVTISLLKIIQPVNPLTFRNNNITQNHYVTLSSTSNLDKQMLYRQKGVGYADGSWKPYSLSGLTKCPRLEIPMLGLVMFSGDATHTSGLLRFVTTNVAGVHGDIRNLIGGELVLDYLFEGLFTNSDIESVSLVLPSSTANSCYYLMFKNCTNLKSVYSGMLTAVTDMDTYSCYRMFLGCTSLTSVPLLPATGLAWCCYTQMFANCTSLTTVPDLPAETLTNYCYLYMFRGCSNLSTVPSGLLSSTTLADLCYYGMFWDCSNLTEAPYLPATTLVSTCYRNMFKGCSKLSSISADFTSWSYATLDWVDGVASVGTFYKPYELAETFDKDHIPSGWTVVNTTEPDYSAMPFTLKIVNVGDNGGDIGINRNDTSIHYDIVRGGNVISSGYNPSNGHLSGIFEVGDEIRFTASKSNGDNTTFYTKLNTQVIVYGNIMSLANGATTTTIDNLFKYLFYGTSGDAAGSSHYFVIDASNLILPVLDLPQAIYHSMFKNNFALTAAPELPATGLNRECYREMFYGCSSLIVPPSVLPAEHILFQSYGSMFSGCTAMSTTPEIYAIIPLAQCFASMFRNCINITSCNIPTTGISFYGYASLFEGCSKLSSIEINFNTGFGDNSNGWVKGVASSGVFIKPAGGVTTRGDDYIPNNWTIVDK